MIANEHVRTLEVVAYESYIVFVTAFEGPRRMSTITSKIGFLLSDTPPITAFCQLLKLEPVLGFLKCS